MNLDSLILLAPLMVCWSIFMFSESLVSTLLALLLCSLALPLEFMEVYKVFWPCGLLLVLMSTGLMVIFAYIVSLHEGGSSLGSKSWLLPALSLLLLSLVISGSNLNHCHLSTIELKVDVNISVGLIMISVLLFLVVTFVRLVYSKGGGFRKKF